MAEYKIQEDYEEYEDYDQYEDYTDETDYTEEDYEEFEKGSKDGIPLLGILAGFSKWFIRIGIAIGVILLVMFFVTGKPGTAFLYFFGLVISFFFGYGFMFLLDFFISRNDKEVHS